MLHNILDFPAITQFCGDCGWSGCCVNLRMKRCKQPDPKTGRSLPYRRDTHLFRQGDELDSLYFLRSGSMKTVVSTKGGSEHIVTFHFPGDLIGFDSIASGRHQSTAVTLETSGVCRIPLVKLMSASTNNSKLWEAMIRTAGAQIAEKQNYALLLGRKSVHARFATFLVYLSCKYSSRGCSDAEFNLSMSRQDIASYLAMAVETLSRLIGDFQRNGLISVERRFVRIKDVPKLREMAQENVDLSLSFG
jgi:CRP/FNR family transcriptional regulator